MLRSRLPSAWLLPLALVAVTGCAHLRRLGEPVEEHAAYRAVRVGRTLEDRLAAAARYLREHPHGVHHEEVQAYLEHAGGLYYASKRGSVAGLERYLATLPDGPHAALATRSLTRRREEARRGDDLLRAASAAELRLERAAARREEVVRTFRTWTLLLLEPATWDRPLSAAKEELIVTWSLDLPHPVCRDGACVKSLRLPYEVPGQGERASREAAIDVTLYKDPSGVVRRATLGGPDLIVRLVEARRGRAVDRESSEEHIDAVAAAVDLVKDLGQTRFGRACARSAEAPVVVELVCEGFRVALAAGGEPGERDVLTIEREAAQGGPDAGR